MTKWLERKLSELGEITTGKTPPSSQPNFYGGNIPFVTPSDMDIRRTIDTTARYLTNAGALNVKSSFINKPAICVSCIGSDMGKAVLVDHPFVSNQQINSIVVYGYVERLFVYYNLLGRKDEIRFKASGAAQPIMNKSDFGRLTLRVPDQPTQKQIAKVLGSLDDKIELNRRMNETLEEMARALFRDWFIDFGPTRRQMDGATDPAAIMGHAFPDNKAAALAPLFPARQGEDGLPEGWKMGTLKDYGVVKNGFAFKSKDWRDMGVPVLKIKNVKPRLVSLDGCGFIDIGLAREKSNFQLQSGDILVGMTGYVGEVGRVPETKPLPMLNQRVGHIKAEYLEGFSPFIFSCTRQPEFKEHAVASSHGSAQANVSTKDLELFGVIIAGKTIVAAYDRFATPIFDRMQLADTENQTLTKMRDLLLPKLMSGEILLKPSEGGYE